MNIKMHPDGDTLVLGSTLARRNSQELILGLPRWRLRQQHQQKSDSKKVIGHDIIHRHSRKLMKFLAS